MSPAPILLLVSSLLSAHPTPAPCTFARLVREAPVLTLPVTLGANPFLVGGTPRSGASLQACLAAPLAHVAGDTRKYDDGTELAELMQNLATHREPGSPTTTLTLVGRIKQGKNTVLFARFNHRDAEEGEGYETEKVYLFVFTEKGKLLDWNLFAAATGDDFGSASRIGMLEGDGTITLLPEVSVFENQTTFAKESTSFRIERDGHIRDLGSTPTRIFRGGRSENEMVVIFGELFEKNGSGSIAYRLPEADPGQARFERMTVDWEQSTAGTLIVRSAKATGPELTLRLEDLGLLIWGSDGKRRMLFAQ